LNEILVSKETSIQMDGKQCLEQIDIFFLDSLGILHKDVIKENFCSNFQEIEKDGSTGYIKQKRDTEFAC